MCSRVDPFHRSAKRNEDGGKGCSSTCGDNIVIGRDSAGCNHAVKWIVSSQNYLHLKSFLLANIPHGASYCVSRVAFSLGSQFIHGQFPVVTTFICRNSTDRKNKVARELFRSLFEKDCERGNSSWLNQVQQHHAIIFCQDLPLSVQEPDTDANLFQHEGARVFDFAQDPQASKRRKAEMHPLMGKSNRSWSRPDTCWKAVS